MFDKYVEKVLEFRHKNCRELVPTSHLNSATSLCYLLDALVTSENGVSAVCDCIERLFPYLPFTSLSPSLSLHVLPLPPSLHPSLPPSLPPCLPPSLLSLLTFSLPCMYIYTQVDPSDMEVCETMVEQWFLFSVIWSLCAGVDEDGRKKMDSFIREMEGQFPPKVHVYGVYNVHVHVCTGAHTMYFQFDS